MKERPILFNAEMVQAILSGRKTQTRRVIKLPLIDKNMGCELAGNELAGEIKAGDYRNCPLGQPGDQLWVREAFRVMCCATDVARLMYRASERNSFTESTRTVPVAICDKQPSQNWTPSLHMPRWASRTNLLITGVRVERLNDISEEDARAEGITNGGCINCGECEPCGCEHPAPDATEMFAHLWQSIYGDASWFSNPWVWVMEFEVKKVGSHD